MNLNWDVKVNFKEWRWEFTFKGTRVLQWIIIIAAMLIGGTLFYGPGLLCASNLQIIGAGILVTGGVACIIKLQKKQA